MAVHQARCSVPSPLTGLVTQPQPVVRPSVGLRHLVFLSSGNPAWELGALRAAVGLSVDLHLLCSALLAGLPGKACVCMCTDIFVFRKKPVCFWWNI